MSIPNFVVNNLSAVQGKRIKIVGGIDTSIEECPYLTSLQHESNNLHLCTGSIIAHQYILTTAHCVMEPFVSFKDLRIHVGTNNTSSGKGLWYLPEKYFSHPMFSITKNEKVKHANDISIIKLYGYIEFNKYQNKINLPTTNILTAEIGTISGWGANTYPSYYASNILKKVSMTTIDTDNCQNYVPFAINSDQFCAYYKKGSGPCIGDSGAPLVKDSTTLIGILTLSIPCGTGAPDLYTNVYNHLGFIKSVLREDD
ncbi:PREDICTED: chymotrypsin-2-like [Ceratosolen solmsi marchali]|uniref:Chymotrypsin-2-like n=1 Tax=Ceratosolen solmsi marchali TaxID=326594 RepID=A0AAJ6YSC1_9HYME|nr:PREDICTED: chymotrypsin-2-like [Ceratosolen solmsi marchali]